MSDFMIIADILSVRHEQNSTISHCMILADIPTNRPHAGYNQSNTTDATRGAGTD